MGNVSELLFAVIPSALDGKGLAQLAGSDYLSFSGNDVIPCNNNEGTGGLELTEAAEYIGFRCCAIPR